MNKVPTTPKADLVRLHLDLRGVVQGVGFRPFVYRLAHGLKLAGWVANDGRGASLEIEGPRPRLEEFLERLIQERPPHCEIHEIQRTTQAPQGETYFTIHASQAGGDKRALVLPDLATCPDCLREIFDPKDRRHLYPFTNCTHCGPRFTIVESLPYDRPRTSMKSFPLCPRCLREYQDPLDRRFHAQPTACPDCGPQLEFWDRSGKILGRRDQGLKMAAEAIRQGRIVAVKGLGGFHLMADARDAGVLAALRRRKQREEKPFAVLMPSLEAVRRHCRVSHAEAELLISYQAPIVILDALPGAGLAPQVAPDNPTFGVLLPSNPLHHLLMDELGFPLVATSGNLSDEPICIDEKEALQRLGNVADCFLAHNRPIVRHADDSIARIMMGAPVVQRRARGYAPLPISLGAGMPSLLALGGHLKSTVAVAREGDVFLSQHLGDLETPQAMAAFERAEKDLRAFYEIEPEAVLCDGHPDYISTQYGAGLGLPLARVQHHVAHAASCIAENGVQEPCLGVAWDGMGWGPDGTVWGGEFFTLAPGQAERAAFLRPFRLPGGNLAAREPRRSAVGLLYELQGEDFLGRAGAASLAAFDPGELQVVAHSLRRGLNAPLCSSAGRLFDAVSSLLDLRHFNRFEGQAAMQLGLAAEAGQPCGEHYPFAIEESGQARVINWGPMLEALLADLRAGLGSPLLAARFHNTLAEMIVEVARRVAIPRVALSGGCFQNRLLLEKTVAGLRAAGFQAFWQSQVPSNDGGISLGQVQAWARGWILK